MSVSESEKVLIIQKREELRVISQETLDLLNKKIESPQDITEIKKKILHILSLVHIISSHVNTTANLDQLIPMVAEIVDSLEDSKTRERGKVNAEAFCFIVNIIPFSYSPWPSFFKTNIATGFLEIHK